MYRESTSVASSSSAERIPLEQLLAKQDEHLAQLAECSATRVVDELQNQILLMQRNQKHFASLQHRATAPPRVVDLSGATVHQFNRDRYWGKEEDERREQTLAAASEAELVVRPLYASWEKGPNRLAHYTREVKWFYEVVFGERLEGDTLPSGADWSVHVVDQAQRDAALSSQHTANRLLLNEKIRQLPLLVRQFSGKEDDLFKLLKAKYAAPYYEFLDW